MRNRGTATRYPGVYRVDDDKYWVRAKATDLRTGKKKEVEKLLEGVSLQEAAQPPSVPTCLRQQTRS